MNRAVRTVGAVAAVTLVAAACGEDPPNNLDRGTATAPAAAVTVVGENTMFDVTSLDAAVGQDLVITFDNRDDGLQHNLHVRDTTDGEARTEISEGPVTQELTVRFDQPGEHEYLCDVHPDQMQGTVTVTG